MKSDLDALMQARNLDAILVLGNAEHNPSMYYLTGGGHISGAALVKKRGAAPILFCQSMEREEAAKSGLNVVAMSRKPVDDLLKDDIRQIFLEANLTAGRVGVYGQTNSSVVVALVAHLAGLLPAITLVGEANDDHIFLHLMETKNESEVARIRKMGRLTTEVVGKVAGYLTARQVREDEVLLKEDGRPLTVAEVKARINLWLAELGAENPEGTIFAIGRDAGVPHSSGNPEDVLRLGRTIIFDIFPCEAGGGYFYDFTRTWCLGYAPQEAQELHAQVFAAYKRATESLVPNMPFRECQRLVCEFFEAQGHRSPLNTPVPIEGYVHSIGHGVGLNVQERPWSRLTSSEDNRLTPGVVVTVEPGLYYPERGMGVRIEDTLWIRPDGKVEVLAEYPYDLVLEIKKWKP